MANPAGETQNGVLRLDFDRRVMLQFRAGGANRAAKSGKRQFPAEPLLHNGESQFIWRIPVNKPPFSNYPVYDKEYLLLRSLVVFKIPIIAIASVIALVGSVPAGAADQPTPRELYLQAIYAMNNLKQPKYITYRLVSINEGLRNNLRPAGRGQIEFVHGTTTDSWTMSHRTQDYLTEMVDTTDGHRNLSNHPAFDPTWYGPYRSLRDGMIDYTDTGKPLMQPSSSTTPEPDPTLKTIGAVTVMGPAIYNIEDRGTVACSNGDPGHALHLWSRTKNWRHQLSDVVIDLKSMRFCMMRLTLSRPLDNRTTWELHFGNVGGYWMQTDGLIEGRGRLPGISTQHGIWRYKLVGVNFPNSLPAQTFDALAPAFDPSPYLHAQQLVDIGGRRLNLYCTGTGSPTVILDANEGDDTSDWRFVQPLVAKHTHVCSYDRAGFGFSDAGPLPRDAAATVNDLRALLAKGAFVKPFVLVAYSSSTLSARLYADRYLDSLAGLVLVEPDIEDQETALFAVAPSLEPIFAQGWAAAKACTAATQRGDLKPRTSLYEVCAGSDPPELPASLNAVIRRRMLRPQWWSAYNSDQTSDRTISTSEVRKEQRTYGSLPLAVVSAIDAFPSTWPLPPAQRRAEQRFMGQMHDSLAKFSSSAEHVKVNACSHGDIATRCAASVASSIEKVIDQARQPRLRDL